jgi:hypothetical protein
VGWGHGVGARGLLRGARAGGEVKRVGQGSLGQGVQGEQVERAQEFGDFWGSHGGMGRRGAREPVLWREGERTS